MKENLETHLEGKKGIKTDALAYWWCPNLRTERASLREKPESKKSKVKSRELA